MKKIVALLCVLLFASTLCFAEDYLEEAEDYLEEADDYDDGYVYDASGAGDQQLKIGLMPLFPLNFGNSLYVGGAAELGFYKFINKYVALGGEFSASFNVTLGSNALTMVPFTFGVMVQPSVGKFEFPLTLSAGFAYETCANSSYFPGFVLNTEAGAYFRFSEMWSFGVGGKFMWLPQWVKDSSRNFDGLFAAAGIFARYHF